MVLNVTASIASGAVLESVVGMTPLEKIRLGPAAAVDETESTIERERVPERLAVGGRKAVERRRGCDL
jgi:hypothetical protein